ncbi:MAG TPA: tetratricopeptide repeat protein [Vicinamibacterales bacterium]|nr:tetratricopeptide repeat protein [Vicinamibacterales bacterium]
MKSRLSAFTLALLLALGVPLRADKFSLKGLAAPSGKLGEALSALAEGKLDDADRKLQEVLKEYPGLAFAELGRAQVLLDKKQIDDADRIVTGVLARDPQSPTAHNMKGVVLLLQKKSDLARAEFARAAALAPTYVIPRIYIAAISRASQNYAQAAADYRDIIGVAPRLPFGYLGLAEAQMMQQQEPAALKTLADWKAADPKAVLPFQVTGTVYLTEGNTTAAIPELKAGLARKPADPGLLTTLGAAYAASGDVRSAAAQYQAALAADATAVDAVLGLAELDVRAGKPDDALARYRSALKIDPGNAVAANDVAWLLAERGGKMDLDEALKLVSSVVQDMPSYVDARDTLGWVYYRRADYPNAVTALQKAKALAPDRLDIAGHLGLAYAKVGRKTEAIAELKRALAAKGDVPNRAELQRVLADLQKSS